MPITYKKLWKLLIDKEMNKTQLRDTAGISGNVIAKLGKNEPVALASLIKISETLGVDIGDIISLEQSNIKK
ncbi:helix-turn-helix domain-containing protein [Lactococcus carnosus]|uniref:Helix-turn-helix transcriptional regulator n=1 Tax=Pseudolactococcus carnosus TaxID=2749961 RepID=A0ABT0ARC7_9LACT|nr:helix-turn-helix transcriptional regulator [Lactococcus carnosus]